LSECSCPTVSLAGFTSWVYNVMGVPETALPSDSQSLTFAYCFAIAVVNQALRCVPGPLYLAAVYNLGGDNLINYAQDTDSTTPKGFWADLRLQFKITPFVAGVISSTSDQSTAESLEVIEAAKGFLLSDLQNLKTPYGRAYLAIAMKFGSLWGLTR
jgi:hypothetical protein